MRNGIAPLEADLDGLRPVRRPFGVDGPAPHVRRRLGPGILQLAALVGDVQQVGVHRVRRAAALLALDGDAVLLGMTFLREVDFRQQGGRLILQPAGGR